MKKMLPYISVILCTIFPILFLFGQNNKEVKMNELGYPLLLYLAIAVILMLIGLTLWRNQLKASLFAVFMELLLFNFNLIQRIVQKIIPQLRYWHIIVLSVATIIILLVILYHKVSLENITNICLVVTIVFFPLDIINIFPPLISIVVSTDEKIVENNEGSIIDENTAKDKNLPNIYFMLFDEYASNDQLVNFYKYDNTPFLSTLEEDGFYISSSSSNYCAATSIMMGEFINFSYDNSITDGADTRLLEMRKQGNIYKQLEEIGYEVSLVATKDNLDFLDPGKVLGEHDGISSATTINGEKFTDILLNQSFLNPFIQGNRTQELKENLDLLDQLNNIAKEPDSSQFVFYYITMPHQPFYLDENGHSVSAAHWGDWSNPQYYVGQLRYLNNRIIPAMTEIIQKDQDSIIILCSDHGARTAPSGVSSMDGYEKMIFNCIYFQGNSDPNFEGLSSINTIRYILNKVCNIDMPLLEAPERS